MRTGAELLTAMSRFLNDEWTSTLTSNGNAGGTTIIDTTLRRFGDDAVRGQYIRITQAGATQFEVRRVSGFTAATGTSTVAPAFSAQINSGDSYELHAWDPATKFTALDEARIQIYPDLAQLIYDDSVTADGFSRSFRIPAPLRGGPMWIFEEHPQAAEVDWNFLTNPLGDSVTNWTDANMTTSIVSWNDNDPIIPKYDNSAMKMAVAGSTNGTLTQVIADMTNEITAALSAGRRMTYGKWIYCREPNRLSVQITDDQETLSSRLHRGSGWELLSISRDVVPNNSTALSVVTDVASGPTAVTAWWNRAWFYFGDDDRIHDIYPLKNGHHVRRDDSEQRVMLDFLPGKGHQLRMIGRDTLSSLGTDTRSQVQNSMEVDEAGEMVLVGEAVRILFQRAGLSADDVGEVSQRLSAADQRRRELKSKWRNILPARVRARGYWKA